MRSNVLGTVYLIHFDKKLAHAKHYIGWTEGELQDRLKCHREGKGSSILRALKKKGISFRVVRTWENVDRHFERKIKKQKNSRNHCPLCGRRKRRCNSKLNHVNTKETTLKKANTPLVGRVSGR